MTKLFYALALLMMAGIVSAGTVTLTGACSRLGISGNVMNFSLSNSGNDTAFNMIVTPMIQNVQTARSFYAINSLGPKTIETLTMNLTNIDVKGTSAGYFSVAYQQGGDVFTAVFPCLLSFYNVTESPLLIIPRTSTAANGNTTVLLSVFNAGATAIDANVSLMLPPAFTYKSSKYFQLSIAPYQTANFTFLLRFPSTNQVSYSVAAFASYMQNGLSHASLRTFIIASNPPVPANFSFMLILLAAVVVVAVLALIVFSILRKRGKKKA